MTNKASGIAWKDVKDEASEILARYVRIKTVNPPGDEEEAARFLASVLKKDGIDFKYLSIRSQTGQHPGAAEGRRPTGIDFSFPHRHGRGRGLHVGF